MNPRLRTYTYMIGGAFWVALAAESVLNRSMFASFSEMAPLIMLAVAGEELVFRKREHGGDAAISFSAIAHVAAAVLLSPAAAAATAAVGVLIGDGLRRDGRRFLLINSAMFGGSTWAAALAYRGLGGDSAHLSLRSAAALLAVLVVRYAVTTTIFCGGISISRGRPFFPLLGEAGLEELGAAVCEGSLGVLIAVGVADNAIILPFVVPLFGALYASKANFVRLRTETQRALNAMADVIDARDPSTAEHSERVASYVEQFVQALRLPHRTAEQLVTAARYHDLGKIAVDVRTLTSAERLSEADVAQIRQHPRVSALLLRPFSFARDIAEFAELHHERLDGRGYYGADGSRLPIESHVLIVADSFDAMTSDRPYRPPLTREEAFHELLDKAGTQFHPLVARAFVATLSGKHVEEVLSPSEVAELRSQFRRVRRISFTSPIAWRPRAAVLGSIVLTLALAAIPAVPLWALSIPIAATGVSAAAWIVTAAQLERRRRRATGCLAAGLSAEAVLRAAGFVGSAGWLPLDVEVPPSALPCLTAVDLAEAQSRARRRDDTQLVSFPNGTTVAFSGTVRNRCHYVVALVQRPRRRELELAEWIAAALADSGGPAAEPIRAERRSAGERRAVILVALEGFERVRQTAGQLVAERVVSDVERELRSSLRQNDAIIRIDDDTFGISALVGEPEGLDRLTTEIARIVEGVRLPARLERLSPRVAASLEEEAGAIPELAAIEAKLLPDDTAAERTR
jgi:HD-GYP domain-containing protein (c-di-GMP phosphodiesterase class II)/GGDEF domain-containing protein